MAKFILSAVALASTVYAQCSGPSITIRTQEDASSIQGCSTYNGDVIIDPSASGNIQINGVGAITGDLRAVNATQLTGISSDILATISGTFDLEELTIMSTLQFSSLNAVNKIRWVAVPALQTLNFVRGVSKANQVYISNTGLTDLRGIELTSVGSIDVNNNQYLKNINVNALTNVTNALAFSANGPNLDIEFPNLIAAANLTFRNVTTISMPSLGSVAGSMGFYNNYFSSFSAPNLTMVGNTIAFVSSSSLSSLAFPSLTIVGGGLQLANNTQLKSVTGFPALSAIRGDINFYGTFDAVAFGNLSNVAGAANIVTSSQNQSICDYFQQAQSHQVIKGKVNCKVNVGSSLTNGSSSSGNGTSTNGATSNLRFDAFAPLTGLAALVAAALLI